ncbi:hypothetical protein DFH27DRAFT_161269 [Peziza echinospora]|nr:hypothetical protein DFH27DRAFT_161269 [Peziza echinospora]
MSSSTSSPPGHAEPSPSSPAGGHSESISSVEQIKVPAAAEIITTTPSSTQPTTKEKHIILRLLDIPTKFLGFKTSYNLVLWFIFGGAMFFFVCLRFNRIDPQSGLKHGAPGTWYWSRRKVYKIGFMLHMSAILPASFLSVFQFIPIIRYKFLIAHRISGYAIYILLVISSIGALIMTRRALGGGFPMQLAIVLFTATTLFSASMAYYNIKRLQIDQHRKWMLRTMFYMGSIITARIIGIAFSDIYFKYLHYQSAYRVWNCDELEYTVVKQYGLPKEYYFDVKYPECVMPSPLEANTTAEALQTVFMNTFTAVQASVQFDKGAGPENAGTAFYWSFESAMFLALFIHMIGVEFYIRLTPGEDARLRQYSYQRQLEAGNTRYPGNAGTTRDRVGDAGDFPFKFQEKEPQGVGK